MSPVEVDEGATDLRAPLVLHFAGPAVARQRLSVRDLILLVGQVQIAIDRVAIVLGGEANSLLRGRRTSEVERACSLDIVRVSGGGSVTVTCDLPYRPQKTLPGTEDVGESAARILVSGIDQLTGDDAVELPQGYDKGVLLALKEFGRAFERGFDEVGIELTVGATHLRPKFTRLTYQRIVERIHGPVKNPYEVEGRLLMADFKESGLRCRIHPPVGQPIPCEFEEHQKDLVLAGITHYVRVVGEAIVVDNQVKTLLIQDLDILDYGPVPTIGLGIQTVGVRGLAALDELAEQQRVAPIKDPAALYGDFWPEDEDVDVFLSAVRRWRREGRSREST